MLDDEDGWDAHAALQQADVGAMQPRSVGQTLLGQTSCYTAAANHGSELSLKRFHTNEERARPLLLPQTIV